MPSKAIFYFHFDIFIFENKVARDKMQLKGQFVLCPAAMECPGSYGDRQYNDQKKKDRQYNDQKKKDR